MLWYIVHKEKLKEIQIYIRSFVAILRDTEVLFNSIEDKAKCFHR